MSIKMKSQSLLTVFLVGSLCGLTNYVNASHDDFNEEEGSRLQITGATNLILAAIADSDVNVAGVQTTVDALQDNGVPAGTVIVGADSAFTATTNDLTSISRALSAIEGTGFVPGTDSLKIISDNQGTQGLGALATAAIQTTQGTTALATLANQTTQGLVALATASAQATQGVGPLATSAQGATIIANQGTQGTAALATFAVQALQATSVQAVAIQGASFDTTLASLMIGFRQVALAQVLAAASNPAITTVLTAGTNFAAFNTATTDPAVGSVFSRLQAALASPSNTTIPAVVTAINTAQAVGLAGAVTPFTLPTVLAALQGLENAVASWSAFYP